MLYLDVSLKKTTCFDASMHHLHGVLLLYQRYMPVKKQRNSLKIMQCSIETC